MDDDEDDTILDNNWMHSFQEEEKLFKDFYKDDVWHIRLRFVYVNFENEIDCMREETFLMSKRNRILEEELLHILKCASTLNSQRYSLISILRYNVLMEPSEVTHSLRKEAGKPDMDSSYLSVVTHLNDIVFDRTIAMFQDLNELTFVFCAKSNVKDSSTKRVYIRRSARRKKTVRQKI